ncbi:hypothetical protein [Streptomonospora arabica]|uniref:ABC transporter permease n=1 Tax=Streptomonospora arabica TaxID=412417 RepID=A0ABV9SP14_9ACTN
MSARILRTELRRSTAPWICLALAVLTLALLYLLPGPWAKGTGAWDQQWQGLVQWQRFMLMFTWPVVVGLGAWQGTRQHRSRMDEVLSSTPRSPWQRSATLAAAVAIGLTVACTAIFAVGAAQVASATSYFSLSWLAVFAVGVLALVAGSLLGMGLGHLLPYMVTPPLVAVGGYALVMMLLNIGISVEAGSDPWRMKVALLSPALDGAESAYRLVAHQVSLAQALWFLGIAATGFVLLAARGSWTRIASAVPGLLGGVLAMVLLPGQASAAYPHDTQAAALVCDEDGPRVCVTRAHEHLLDDFAGTAGQALAKLAVLPEAPTSVEEVPAFGNEERASLPRTADTVSVSSDILMRFEQSGEGESDGGDGLLRALLAGAGTPACGVEETEISARIVTANWLLGAELQPIPILYPWISEDSSAYQEMVRPAWETLRSLPREEQVRRVAAVREAGLTCEGDQLDLLTQGVNPR